MSRFAETFAESNLKSFEILVDALADKAGIPEDSQLRTRFVEYSASLLKGLALIEQDKMAGKPTKIAESALKANFTEVQYLVTADLAAALVGALEAKFLDTAMRTSGVLLALL